MSFKDHMDENGIFTSSNETQGGGVEHEVFLLKQRSYANQSTAKTMEFIKLNGLDNTPSHLLFSIANMILNENIERKNGDVSYRTLFLLKKVLQMIERRMSTQAEVSRNQNSIYKVREEKFLSRIKLLETLVKGTIEENEVVMKNLGQIKVEKINMEETIKREEYDLRIMRKEKDNADIEVLTLKEECELTKRKHEKHCLQLEDEIRETKLGMEKKLKELELKLKDSKKRVLELEEFSESKHKRWKKKEHKYQRIMDFHFGALQELRAAAEFMKSEVLKTRRHYFDELNCLGARLKGLVDAAQNYHIVLAENRRLYNEVQDLKGNIRVYCRIRPFLPGQSAKHTTIEYMGENGELVVANPLKQGKDSHRLFKFNKVYGPIATQEEVFGDTRPLIRSVLDGYSVCIFAYGQTGSGKTYTMSGPSVTSKDKWGVNYRALNDLFQIAQSRRASVTYEVGVQMVEIYNEQVRDLLSTSGSQKRLGIWSTTQPNGLAVPDASMHIVKSTKNVLELMSVGMTNRAVGATALNERSSRSHSILTVHVRGTDLETNTILRGNLHLVDLAGSERVERSEATGERLKEAQHINKSLSALGDVIFALAQKNSHVPYRNSKLTQVLQSSLGGQAKTLMFVQLNPDTDSYSETVSTLKFAERVSGVELGAAKSNKEGREVRELMQQIALLKDTVSKKDEEIVRLLSLKPNVSREKSAISSLRFGSASQRPLLGTPQPSQSISGIKVLDGDNCSQYSEASSIHSPDDLGQNREIERNPIGDADSEERLSDISGSGLSMGTETDDSLPGIVEQTPFPEPQNPPEKSDEPPERFQNPEKETTNTSNPLKLQQKPVEKKPSRLTKSSTKVSTSTRKITAGSSSSSKLPVKRW